MQTSHVPPTAQSESPPRRQVRVAVGLGLGPMDEEMKARDLRRMKALATGLLLAATAVFVAARR